jgi:thymidylate synthase ThyX
MTTTATVILDSISPTGHRLTTLHLCYPRIIHGEFMTHRMFSRNAGSSRAIPIETMISNVLNNTYMPDWTQNQKGMSGEPLSDVNWYDANWVWLDARDNAIASVHALMKLGVHKQDANRLLEPFQYIDVICSATEYDNFFKQRLAPDVHPAMQVLAKTMKQAMDESKPVGREWHLPYVLPEDADLSLDEQRHVSVARCARVSYKPFNSDKVYREADKALYVKLLESGHWSPFEHQGRAAGTYGIRSGNFIGWHQFRQQIEPMYRKFIT